MPRTPGGAGGCGTGRMISPSRVLTETSRAMIGLAVHGCGPDARFLAVDAHRVAAELVTQRGEHAPRERIRIARVEPTEQRQRDHRRRDVLVDGGLDRPPAFARIVDPALVVLQLEVLVQGVYGQVEQP